MKYKFDYSKDKDAVLKETRGLGFEDIIQAIDSGKLLDDKRNPSNKYPKQKIFVVEIKGYVYVVPYVTDEERNVFFLKTFYPNRKLTKQYLKK